MGVTKKQNLKKKNLRKTKTIRKRRTNKKKIRILGGLTIDVGTGKINLNIDDLFNEDKTETIKLIKEKNDLSKKKVRQNLFQKLQGEYIEQLNTYKNKNITVLKEKNLSENNFSKTTYLRGADLTDANLTKAFFIDADLTGADLTGADLTGADFTGAKLQGANLSNTIMDEQTMLSHKINNKTNFSNAKLKLTPSPFFSNPFSNSFLSNEDLKKDDLIHNNKDRTEVTLGEKTHKYVVLDGKSYSDGKEFLKNNLKFLLYSSTGKTPLKHLLPLGYHFDDNNKDLPPHIENNKSLESIIVSFEENKG